MKKTSNDSLQVRNRLHQSHTIRPSKKINHAEI